MEKPWGSGRLNLSRLIWCFSTVCAEYGGSPSFLYYYQSRCSCVIVAINSVFAIRRITIVIQCCKGQLGSEVQRDIYCYSEVVFLKDFLFMHYWIFLRVNVWSKLGGDWGHTHWKDTAPHHGLINPGVKRSRKADPAWFIACVKQLLRTHFSKGRLVVIMLSAHHCALRCGRWVWLMPTGDVSCCLTGLLETVSLCFFGKWHIAHIRQ